MTGLTPTRVTKADLDWWLELAPHLNWIFAKTYAETAPHSYVVRGRTKGMADVDFARAGRVIRTFGQPGKFYDTTNIYLTSPDGTLKWWTMDAAAASTTLVNQATTDRVYGEQNAPSTYSGIWSVYDEIATDYDRLWSPVDGDEKVGLLRLIDSLGLENPTTLDIGCGTGALLDLGITTPDRYVGVDSSQAMLNELVVKHSRRQLGCVLPMNAEESLTATNGERFQLVAALFGKASFLEAKTFSALRSRCAGALILMAYGKSYRSEFPDWIPESSTDAVEALRDFAETYGTATTLVGKFEVATIRLDPEAQVGSW